MLALLALTACTDARPMDAGAPDGDASAAADADARAPRNLLETVPSTEQWELPGLTGEAYVLRTEGDVPHVYAQNRVDLARVQGFTLARHRFFMMDMARRLAQGRVSELLGDAALNTDMQSRGTAMTFVAQQIEQALTPNQQRILDAFAEGVNAYIEQVRRNRVTAPSEFTLAAPLLGQRNAAALMVPFNRRDMAAILATLVYELGFETDDVGRARANDALPGDYTGAPLAELRRAGARADIFDRYTPDRPTTSAAGFGLETSRPMMAEGTPPFAPRTFAGRPAAPPRARDLAAQQRRHTGTVVPAHSGVPVDTLTRLSAQLHQIETRLGRVEGFGSNAWAVMGAAARDGAALLAGDGHLPLTVPSLFYQIGLDTTVLGGAASTEAVHQMGLTIPGFPMLAVGTNGRVAWCQTQLSGDITDWYREEITLGADGLPAASRFQNSPRPLVRTDERFVIADVPALNSRGRTETWPRFTTFDGRWITAIEGRTVTRDEPLRAGEARVQLLGAFVVPSDTDGDGVISAVSFDYTALDPANLITALDGFGRAANVTDFRAATRGLVAYSQNIVAADADGSVLYTSYQAVPCRGYLERNPDGSWGPGANPMYLLDGNRFGGFRIPVRDGLVDEAPGATDPYACVVPFDRTPQALDPLRGYVLTANNQPGDINNDNSLTNDPFYIGGPWVEANRAARIDALLRAATMSRSADEDRMAAIQADNRSPLGDRFVPVLLDAIAQAQVAAAATPPPAPDSPEGRLAARYTANMADYDEVRRRLVAWRDAGEYRTPSGVATFYNTPAAGDADNAVATMIFNAWVGRFVAGVFDDERFPDGIWSNGGTGARVRTLALMCEGRGAGNPSMLASYNPATGESAYFDVRDTPAIETSREVALAALDGALEFLRSAPTGPGAGGFGTRDMNAWVWGLRHHVRFESILGEFLGDNPMLSFLADRYAITPRQLPLAPDLPMSDPRAALPGFPRAGDQFVVDAANPGLSGTRFSFGSGANFRMVIALRREATTGRNVVPGGQSGLENSRFYSDQAALWLGNRTTPMHLSAQAVVAAATGREDFHPPR